MPSATSCRAARDAIDLMRSTSSSAAAVVGNSAVKSRDEAQIKAALSGYTPSELRVDEARNRQDVAY